MPSTSPKAIARKRGRTTTPRTTPSGCRWLRWKSCCSRCRKFVPPSEPPPRRLGPEGLRTIVLRIGITGANGFLGWHLRAHLHHRQDVEIRSADRATFADPAKLRDFVSGLDSIAHVAAV